MADTSQSSETQPPKHQKLSNIVTDRISNLPDSLLHHILSYLTTIEAARTSVLSKQWRFLWTCLPNLHIHLGFFRHQGTSFPQILNNILLSRREWSITQFRLTCDYGSDLGPILSAAAERNLEELDFEIDFGHFELPRSFLSCKTSVVLKLWGRVNIKFDCSVQFPSLKVLHLCGAELEDQDSFISLFSGCPVLDEVKICNCVLDCELHYDISSPTIRRLIFYASDEDFELYLSPDISVNAPALEHLTIYHSGPPNFLILENTHNLVEAKVRINHLDSTILIDWTDMEDVFQAISNVQSLELNFDIDQGTDHYIPSPENFPTFDNLVRLKINGRCCFWPFILNMLQNCPILECFTFVQDYRVCEEPQCWVPPEHAPTCLSLHLTKCEFRGFKGSEAELEFTRYLLKNSTILRSMTIIYCEELSYLRDGMFGALRSLSRFERSSASCQVNFERARW